MKLDNLHIGVSPLTDRIYLGTLSKRERNTWASKIDFTSKFLGALMDWIPPGTVQMITDSQGTSYEIQVRKMPDQEKGE